MMRKKRFLLFLFTFAVLTVFNFSFIVSADSEFPPVSFSVSGMESEVESTLSIPSENPLPESSAPSDSSETSSDPVPEEDSSNKLCEDVAAIRQDFDLLLYGVFPLSVSLILFVAFGRWFYVTFIKSAF